MYSLSSSLSLERERGKSRFFSQFENGTSQSTRLHGSRGIGDEEDYVVFRHHDRICQLCHAHRWCNRFATAQAQLGVIYLIVNIKVR